MQGTGTATLEAKLAQQLARLAHYPLFEVFLHIRKVYESLDRGKCLEILRGYKLVPTMDHLLKNYCKQHGIFPK